MTWDAALDRLDAEGHQHAGRFRELCLESNPDREQRDGYRDVVVRLASGQPLPAPPVRVDYAAAPAPRPCCGG